MYRHQKLFSLASGAAVVFLCERGAEAMWPETPASTWWSWAAVVLVVWVIATFRTDVGNLLHKGQPKAGLIPLTEGIDMAWSHMKDVSVPPDADGRRVFRDLAYRMLVGTDGPVWLYGIRPPLQSLTLISNAHEYLFQEDGSAVDMSNMNDRVVSLHVHRAEVKRWVKRTLAERRKAMRKRWSHG